MSFLYLLAGLTLCVAGFMVLTPHPVYMVVSLVGVSLGLGSLALAQGAQFLGLVVVLVYVGAVNVLFLFVIMMINLRVQLTPFILEHAWYSPPLVGGLLTGWSTRVDHPIGLPLWGRPTGELGGFFWGTPRVWGNLVVGLTLLTAMVGAICLTLVGLENYRTQSLYAQTGRSGAVFGLSSSPRPVRPV